jgi:broad specificity phosphatase PhoE
VAKLILVKHAPVRIDPQVISHGQMLSEQGRHRCDWLADELRSLEVSRLYTSVEPKALETAGLVAVRSGLALEPRLNLHENDRTGFGFQSVAELRRKLREFFERPADVVIGNETASAALQRFAEAIANIVSEEQGQNLAVVTHGTVISLFVAHHNPIAPFDLWAALDLPSCVVLDAASFSFNGRSITIQAIKECARFARPSGRTRPVLAVCAITASSIGSGLAI